MSNATFFPNFSNILPENRGPINKLIGNKGYSAEIPDNIILITAQSAKNIYPNFNIAGSNLDINWLYIDPKSAFPQQFTLNFGPTARNNIFVVGSGSSLYGNAKIHGENNICLFGGQTPYPSMFSIVVSGANSTFFWGAGGSSNGLSVFLDGDNAEIIVGDDCMVSQRPTILTSDMHAIVDATTRNWINPPASVIIEPHVWLGIECMILKGSHIGFGSVVGTRAVVATAVPANSVVAGVPAKVVRQNITWIRPSKPSDKAIEEVQLLGKSLLE